jgi:hypothetical protein
LKLKPDAIITEEKISEYLLKWRADNDKSQFLRRAGYTQANWRNLLQDIRSQILPLNRISAKHTYIMEDSSTLKTKRGNLRVVTIWMDEKYTDDKVHHFSLTRRISMPYPLSRLINKDFPERNLHKRSHHR